MTWSELRKRVKAAGGTFVRHGRGAREVWSVNGKTITLQGKHPSAQVSKSIERRVLKLIES